MLPCTLVADTVTLAFPEFINVSGKVMLLPAWTPLKFRLAGLGASAPAVAVPLMPPPCTLRTRRPSVALLVKMKAALMCPTKVGLNLTTAWALWPAANVIGMLKLVLKFASVCVNREIVKLAEPVFVNAIV